MLPYCRVTLARLLRRFGVPVLYPFLTCRRNQSAIGRLRRDWRIEIMPMDIARADALVTTSAHLRFHGAISARLFWVPLRKIVPSASDFMHKRCIKRLKHPSIRSLLPRTAAVQLLSNPDMPYCRAFRALKSASSIIQQHLITGQQGC